MRFLPCLIALGAFAQNAPYLRDWKPDPSEPTARPKVVCAALHSLTGYDLSVMTADAIGAAAGVPEFCRVLIQVQPEIKIEVSLPANWNRRLYMFGNGGYAGESLEAAGRVAHRNAALKLGFAVTQTNTGHDAAREPLGTFTTNQQKLLDYAFRSLHVTAETAKRTAEAFYGSRPTRSYYNGCSTGGRQGLILAQRYPADFDGLVVGAPALNNVATRLRSIATYQALAKAPIPITKLKLLADRVYARCDDKDGLKDGLIDDPRRCDFKASRDVPVCSAGDGPDCFTADQIKVIETIYGDVMLNGKRAAAQSAVYAESALRFMIFPKPDPTYDMTRFNLERDAPLFDWIGKLMNATDPDLTRFRERGGKILMYFGWADPALNPLMGIEYYESVQQRMGAGTRDFFKLYMLPGVFHCSGGVGPACFDPIANLIPWVEHSKAPESIVASRLEGGKVLRSRPLCPYPQVAKYQGQGSIDNANNFRCADPK